MIEFGPALKQPNQQSCGASCVVVARLLHAPTRSLVGFPAEVLATHRRLTSAADPTGALQLPWPRALGTPPWAVARALAAIESVPYRTRLIRWGDHFDEITGAVATHPVAVFIGSPALPRHVTLAIGLDDDVLQVYDPASGSLKTLSRAELRPGGFQVAGWTHPWFAVLPR